MVERRETVKRPDVKHVGRGMGPESSSAFIRDLKEPPFVSRFSFRSHVPIFRSNRNLPRFTSYPFLNFLLSSTFHLFSSLFFFHREHPSFTRFSSFTTLPTLSRFTTTYSSLRLPLSTYSSFQTSFCPGLSLS